MIPGVDINRYAYAGNDPINASDPSGLLADDHPYPGGSSITSHGGEGGSQGDARRYAGSAFPTKTGWGVINCANCGPIKGLEVVAGKSGNLTVVGGLSKVPEVRQTNQIAGLLAITPVKAWLIRSWLSYSLPPQVPVSTVVSWIQEAIRMGQAQNMPLPPGATFAARLGLT
jgi:hypothetical protein